MKPQFANLKIDFWVHHGKVGVTQPTLCLYHHSLMIGSPILAALNELRDETRPSQRLLTFAPCAREQPLLSLRLIAVGQKEHLKVMSIGYDSSAATIEMTDEGLELVTSACESWLAGDEDFGVSPPRSSRKAKALVKLDLESGELWFWGPGYEGP